MGSKFEENLKESKPDLFIYLGNHLLGRSLSAKINKYYEENNIIKPPTVLVDKWINRLFFADRELFDHAIYTVPVPVNHWSYSEFPNTYMGSEGVYNAWKFLYNSSERHSKLVEKNGIWINPEFNTLLMENLILDNRRNFRKANEIGETVTVMFAHPGDTLKQAKKFMKTIKGGA